MNKMNFPKHWEAVRLEEIADVRAGSGFPIKYQGNIEGKYPFYKVSDMNLTGNETLMHTSNNWVEEDVVKLLKAKSFPKNTVIFPKVGAAIHTNKKRLLSRTSLVDNNVMGVVLREHDPCIPYYLLYWFDFIDLGDLSNPGPLPAITATTVKNTTIPLPPLPEQRAIAHILQTIQEAKFTRQREIALERERKAALMDHLFSHGMKGEPRKQTEIGEIPESWKVVRLEDVCTFTTGKLNSEKAVEDGQYPFFTCSQKTFKIDSYSFNQEAILLSGNNAKGIFSVKYYKGKFDAYQRTYIITITDTQQLSYQYFLYDLFLKLELLRKQSIGATTQYLTAAIIRNLEITLPPLSEQQTISSILWSCDEKIAALEKEVAHIDELFHAMLEELMTGQRSAVALIDTEMNV